MAMFNININAEELELLKVLLGDVSRDSAEKATKEDELWRSNEYESTTNMSAIEEFRELPHEYRVNRLERLQFQLYAELDDVIKGKSEGKRYIRIEW